MQSSAPYEWRPTASRSTTLTGASVATAARPAPSAAADAGGDARPAPSAAADAGGDARPAPSLAADAARDALEDATVAEVAEEFIAAAQDGRATNRTGRRYRPSALRDVAGILRGHVVPELGDLRMRDVQWDDLQRLVDDLVAGDLSLSRIRSVVSAIRALFGYAVERGIVDASPADELEIARVEQPGWPDDDADTQPYAEAYDPGRRAARDTPDGDRSRTWAGAIGERPQRVLPEIVLSFAVRAVVAAFIIITLISLAQALLVPA